MDIIDIKELVAAISRTEKLLKKLEYLKETEKKRIRGLNSVIKYLKKKLSYLQQTYKYQYNDCIEEAELYANCMNKSDYE